MYIKGLFGYAQGLLMLLLFAAELLTQFDLHVGSLLRFLEQQPIHALTTITHGVQVYIL